MQALKENYLNIDSIVETFINQHELGINTMYRIYFKSSNSSLKELIAGLVNQLKIECIDYLNKDKDPEELDSYLFYIANSYCNSVAKLTFVPEIKKKIYYSCPGCIFLGKESLLDFNVLLKCHNCTNELSKTNDSKSVFLFKTFSTHNKIGYRCIDCNRFIPYPLNNSYNVSCPYFDCCFVGPWSSLKKMHHPIFRKKREENQIEKCSEINGEIKILRDAIDNEQNTVPYNSSNFTVKHKVLVYQAYKNILDRYPEGMINYLLNNSRSGGFQHKIFQEYIFLLEKSFPFVFKKNKKIYRVNSLLDENLNLFDGISSFEETVSDKLYIKNSTKEFYIGGRKASYSEPFYLGKILSIVDKLTNKSLMDSVIEYSFSKIKMKDVAPGTEVIVNHLRIPPHYQMGGMVYINRARKKIVDRVKLFQDII
jgi:hypothetical protein